MSRPRHEVGRFQTLNWGTRMPRLFALLAILCAHMLPISPAWSLETELHTARIVHVERHYCIVLTDLTVPRSLYPTCLVFRPPYVGNFGFVHFVLKIDDGFYPFYIYDDYTNRFGQTVATITPGNSRYRYDPTSHQPRYLADMYGAFYEKRDIQVLLDKKYFAEMKSGNRALAYAAQVREMRFGSKTFKLSVCFAVGAGAQCRNHDDPAVPPTE